MQNFYSAGPLSPPIQDLQLVNVYTNKLIFKWNESSQCSSLHYDINTTNCGNCPNHTNNSVTCGEVFTNSTRKDLCIFAVKTLACESSLNVTLKGTCIGSAYLIINMNVYINNSCVT